MLYNVITATKNCQSGLQPLLSDLIPLPHSIYTLSSTALSKRYVTLSHVWCRGDRGCRPYSEHLVTVIDAASETYKAIKDLDGLPEAFNEVNSRLPLVKETLLAAKEPAETDGTVNDDQAVRDALSSCKKKVDELDDIFTKIAERAPKKSIYKIYKKLVLKLGKSYRVESLGYDMLADILVLTAHRVFHAATVPKVEVLETAQQDLKGLAPSVPDSEFE
ncbi:hypothetical protein BDV95DRAFT_599625 [Massariosphaeria phaeospora]|uniref:NACHT-NTPase and P-loop NTPases N-terminal domain-containing protein n=1 Tax=Massariosphaeria phaeospora TaxID=100035 RepID=A0A7C8M144_9PLEO|nr:hypothetical protein BDV95DRAFT_599625 [Massariosphaeria phaeospora]